MNAPCKNCKERQLGCHSYCDLYQEFVEANEIKKRKIREQNDEDNFIFEVGRNRRKASTL